MSVKNKSQTSPSRAKITKGKVVVQTETKMFDYESSKESKEEEDGESEEEEEDHDEELKPTKIVKPTKYEKKKKNRAKKSPVAVKPTVETKTSKPRTKEVGSSSKLKDKKV